jgi:ATP-binding cassette subfamily C protein CydC
LDFLLVGVIFLVVLTSFEVLSNISSMAYLYGDIEHSSNRIREIEEISTIPHENFKVFDQDIFPIRFNNVSFAYPSHYSHLVIQNINFKLQKGEKIAIIGMNGSGKTTLVELLLGLRSNYGGSILLGDQELKRFPKHVLSQKFGYLPVNPFMFGTTVRQNLLLANRKAEDSELIQVLRDVNLYNPPDLDLTTQLDEFGKNLSSGEIQRLAIAQSILVDAEVQIFDEPFANLDPESAFKIDQLIREKFKNRTMIFVTHRYINMDIFDTIYVLDQGNIVQNGHHSELMKQEGKYSELLRISNY